MLGSGLMSQAGTPRSAWCRDSGSAVSFPWLCAEVCTMMPVTGAALNPPGWEMNSNSLNALAYCRQCPLFPFTEMRGRLLREARIPCSLLTSLGTDTMPGTFLPAGLCGYQDSQPAGCFILPILSQSPGELGHQSPPGASTCLGTQTRRDGLRHLEKLPTLPHVNEHSQHILVHAQSSVHACGRCRPPQVCGVQPHIPCTGQRVPRADGGFPGGWARAGPAP